MGKALAWVVFAAILLGAGTVLAAVGPHGNYSLNTSACASCHSPHEAQSSNLIKFALGAGSQNDDWKTCTFCHSSTGESKYDVIDGKIATVGGNVYAAQGGGFSNVVAIEGLPPAGVVTTATTDRHNADEPKDTQLVVPGGYTVTPRYTLLCSSCHNPHGTANGRQLQEEVPVLDAYGNATTTTVTGVNYVLTGDLDDEETIWSDSINAWCGACHVDYNQNAAGSGNQTSGTYDSGKYRHRVGMAPDAGVNKDGYDAAKLLLPLSSSGNVTCLTCHLAHGTGVSVTGWTDPTDLGDATNLRMDERGVCQNCHNWDPDTTRPTVASSSAPTLTSIIINYDSYLMRSTAEDTANYSLSGAGTPVVSRAKLQPNLKSVVLTVDPAMVSGLTYTVTISDLRDANGNLVGPGTTTDVTAP